MNERKGDWIQSSSGLRLYPLDPRPEDFNIPDIAAALAKTCRYAGHCQQFYSVAQHSVIMSREFEPFASWCLLHDVAEMLTGDIPRPVKRNLLFNDGTALVGYSVFEHGLLDVIAKRFHLVPFKDVANDIARFDCIMLATERRDIMVQTDDEWVSTKGIEPLRQQIGMWSWLEAERQFVDRAAELGLS